jgi:hypothetical protein
MRSGVKRQCDRALRRGGQTKYFLYGAPKIHDHYGLSIFCMDKHKWNNFIIVFTRCGVCDPPLPTRRGQAFGMTVLGTKAHPAGYAGAAEEVRGAAARARC